MDGLLLDTERLYLEGYRRTRVGLNMGKNDAPYMQTIGMPQDAGQKLFQELLEDTVDAAVFERQWNAEIKTLFQGTLPVKAGVRQLIQQLQQQSIPYAVATSTLTDKANAHLQKAGLGGMFPQLIGGDQVTNGKPAPDIYLRAANTLGINPTHCAAFEDSENGVQAAVAAGMTTVQIPDLKAPGPEMRALGHHIADTLLAGAQLLNLIKPSARGTNDDTAQTLPPSIE